jgi:hypothetical protein
MLLFLSIVGMLSIVPLSVFAATGRWDRTWEALKDYLIAMACLTVPALIFAVIALLPHLWS